MPIYIAHNLDGTNRAMVIAATLKAAAVRFGTSVHQLRQYGWSRAGEPDAKIALGTDHNEVLYQPIDHYPPHTFWRRSRWSSSEVRRASEIRRKEPIG